MKALVALVVLASACEKQAPPAAKQNVAPPGADAAQDSAACSDADIKARMDSAFAAITVYFGEIEKRIPTWQDCAVATKDFTALEPMANGYMAEVVKVKDWGESLGPACKQRVKEAGPVHPEGKKIEERFSPLEDKIKEVLRRCEQHPGFKEAVAKGLRFMKKKKAP